MYRHSRLVTKAIHLLVVISILSTSAPMPMSTTVHAAQPASIDVAKPVRNISSPAFLPTTYRSMPSHVSDPLPRPYLAESVRVAPEVTVQELDNEQTLAQDTDGHPAVISVIVEPAQLPADGKTEALVLIYVTDAEGRPVADGTRVIVEATSGQLSAGEGYTDEGLVRMTLTADRQSQRGEGRLVARVGDLSGETTFIIGRPGRVRIGRENKDVTPDAAAVVQRVRNRLRPTTRGEWAVANRRYDATFGAAGLNLTLKEDDEQERGLLKEVDGGRFSFRLVMIRVGEETLYRNRGRPTTPSVTGNGAHYQRTPTIEESYRALNNSMQQLFTLQEPLENAGNLVIRGFLDTRLRPELVSSEEGILFHLPGAARESGGVLRYSGAVVQDARGQTIYADLALQGRRLTLTVPGEWLAEAEYPVVIDPMIGDPNLISDPRDTQGELDVAYNPDDGEYLVVWGGYDTGGASTDLEGQRVQADGTPVGDLIVISQADNDQLKPAVTYNPDQGEYLVVWTDYRNDIDGDVYGQRVAGDGSLLGDNFAIGATEALQDTPDVAYNPNDGVYLAVWRDRRGEVIYIYGQVISSDGALSGANFAVYDGGGDNYNPRVAYNGQTGEFLVVWSRWGSNIYGQYLSGSGALLDNTGTPENESGSNVAFIVSDDGSSQNYLAVAADDVDGDYLVVWRDKRNDSRGDIYGQVISATGAISGTDFVVAATASVYQDYPDLAYDAVNDIHLVVWRDRRNGGSDIYAQAIVPTGALSGTNVAVYEGSYTQYCPEVAANTTAGGYLAVWRDGRNSTYNVYGRRVSGNGQVYGDSFPVGPVTGNKQYPSAAFNDADDEYLLVWEDYRNGDVDVYGQRLNEAGEPVGGNVRVSTEAATGDQIQPKVAAASAIGYLVVWEDRHSDSLGDIYGQLISSDGVLSGSNFAIAATSDEQDYPNLAYNPDDDLYLVVWIDERDDPYGDVYGQLISSGGILSGNNFIVSAHGGHRTQDRPSVIYNEQSGEFLVVWHQWTSSGNNDIYGQRLSGQGELLDNTDTAADESTEYVSFAITTDGTAQVYPAIAAEEANGNCLVVWMDQRSYDTNNYDVYGQIVSSGGALLGTNVALAVADEYQRIPVVAAMPGETGFMVTWNDKRSGYDLYGQRVSTTGTLIDTNELLVDEVGWLSGLAMTAHTDLPQVLLTWEQSYDLYAQRYSVLMADFEAAPRLGSAPLTVAFTDLSLPAGEIETYEWDFGDGITSTEASPSHTYTQPGLTTAGGAYTVTLTVSGTNGSNTLLRPAYVTVNASFTPETDLRGYWRLDEKTGIRYDLSGNDNHLASVGSVGWAESGYIGSAADMEKDDDEYLVIDDALQSGLAITGSLTLMGWAKPESDSDSMMLAAKYRWYKGEAEEAGYRVGLRSGGLLQMIVSPDGTFQSSYQLLGTTALEVGTWYHVAAVFDIQAREMRLYLDGDLEASSPVNFDYLYPSNAPFMLGANWNDQGQVAQYFDGQLDEWRVYARALSQSEIETVMGLPGASFVGASTQGFAPLVVTYTNTSTNTTTYAWDFGDGSPPSTEENPVHTYTQPGVYTVTLDASDGTLTDTLVRPAYVQTTALDQGLQGHWRLDEESGTRYDNSSHSNNLTDHNTVGSTMGQVGLAGDFERSNSERLSIDHSVQNGLNITGSLTLVGWIKPEIVDQYMIMAAKYEWGVDNRAYRFDVRPTGQMALIISPNGQTSSDYSLVANAGLVPGTWYHVAGVFDAQMQTLSIYLDGELASSRSVNYDHINSSTAPFMLGANMQNGSVTQYFDGVLDEWRVYDRVLSQAEIHSLMSPNPPSADFAAIPSSGIAPLTVVFTNNTIGDVTNYVWNYGDGITSTASTATHTHTYASAGPATAGGAYTVSLTATGPGGSDTRTRTGCITVYEGVVAEFEGSPISDMDSLTVNFVNQSTGNYDTCIWGFGDGNTSPDCNDPSHLYDSPGIYTVILTVSGPGGSDTRTRTNYITVYEGVVAGFEGSPTSGVGSLTVNFDNQSTGDYDTCIWDFGDGNTSPDCNDPSHLYDSPGPATAGGAYTVILTVSGPGGSDTRTRTNYITVYEGVVAEFEGSPTSGVGSLTVNFVNQSTGDYDTCVWDFGDGATSPDCNDPSHLYDSPGPATAGGAYTVSLTISGLGGSDTRTRTDYITVTPPVADFGISSSSSQEPQMVVFNSLTASGTTGYLWDLGDGTTSAEENPVHAYTAPGVYTVVFTATGVTGTDVRARAITIHQNSIYVDDDGDCSGNIPCFDTIQAAVGDVLIEVNYDAVLVAQGTYTSIGANVVMIGTGRDIDLLGGWNDDFTVRDPDTYVSTIDGQGYRRCLNIDAASPLVDGFHIVNGSNRFGAGIFIKNGSPIIQNNVIHDNSASNDLEGLGSGGGIYVAGGSPTIQNNVISGNTTDNGGGGIQVAGGSSTIQNNVISNNTAHDGGGIAVWSDTVNYADWGDAIIQNNVIYGNTANRFGGGISISDAGPIIQNNVIVANRSERGGGIYQDELGESTLDYNNVWKNDPDDYYGGEMRSGSHDISTDPLFVDAERDDFHLTSESPCIDKGDPNTTLDIDFDGESRPQGEGYDIGADEYTLLLQPLEADFTATPRSGAAPLTVNFFNLTTGEVMLHRWNFGDRQVSSLARMHTYTQIGVYTVTLTAYGRDGSDTLTRTNYITVTGPPPIASFTAAPSSGAVPLIVDFTNLTTGDYKTCTWDFGDGDTSDNCNDPRHRYNSSGVYTASLTVSGVSGSDILTRTNYITVTERVVAEFEGSPTSGMDSLTVSFDNQSTGDYETCAWDFGNGNTSHDCNDFNYTYNSPGIYTVILTVSGLGGSDTRTRTDYITVHGPPTADFDGNPTSGVAPLSVTFVNHSTVGLTYLWDFGDGQTSTIINPTHTYTQTGVYTVTLTVTGLGDSDTLTRTHYIAVSQGVTADFSANPTSGVAPLTVNFANLSSGSYDTCTWNFGDGNTIYDDCNDQSHTYISPGPVTAGGAYTVSLTVSGLGGTDVFTRFAYVEVLGADFTAAPRIGAVPRVVTFTDVLSDRVTSRTWNFGDGSPEVITTQVTITHYYTQAGVYTPTLTIMRDGGYQYTEVKPAFIIARGAEFSASPQTGLAPLEVTFTDIVSGPVTDRIWDFGDGEIATDAPVSMTHTYVQPGIYTPTLTVIRDGYTYSQSVPNMIVASQEACAISTTKTTWWDSGFFYRQPLTLTVASPLVYTSDVTQVLALTLDTQTPITDDLMLPDGNDLRVVYLDAGNWRELPRHLGDVGTTNTTVYFPLQATITVTDTGYYLYYGRPSAGHPTADNPPELYPDIASWSTVTTTGSGTFTPTVAFTASTYAGLAPLDVSFSNLTTPTTGIDNYTWNFGDGTPEVHDFAPNHPYANPGPAAADGAYTVTLTAVTDEGLTVIHTWVAAIQVPGLDATADATVSLGERESPTGVAVICAEATVPQSFSSADGRLTITFPPGAVTETIVVTHTPKVWAHFGPKVLTFYDMTATTLDDGRPVTTFDADVVFDFQYGNSVEPEQLEFTIAGFSWNEAIKEWERLPANLDTTGNAVTFQSGHFSDFAVTAVGMNSAPASAVSAAQSDLFSGAATWSYPLHVPPGRNGLQPGLALSYNSHLAETRQTDFQRSGLFGLGFNLEPGFIDIDLTSDVQQYNYDPNGCLVDAWVDFEAYLTLNGARTRLIRQDDWFPDSGNPDLVGDFRLQQDNFLRVQLFRGGNDQRTDFFLIHDDEIKPLPQLYWVVTTKEGTIYRFGDAPNTVQILRTLIISYDASGWGSPGWMSYPKRTYLNEIEDVYGNTVTYGYTRITRRTDDGVAYNPAILLSHINYNADGTRRVVFEYNHDRLDEPSPQAFFPGAAYSYYRDLLSAVSMRVNPGGEFLRYEFGYDHIDFNPMPWGEEQVPVLQTITAKDESGQEFEAQTTFGYYVNESLWRYKGMLRQIENGYGGSTSFSYSLNKRVKKISMLADDAEPIVRKFDIIDVPGERRVSVWNEGGNSETQYAFHTEYDWNPFDTKLPPLTGQLKHITIRDLSTYRIEQTICYEYDPELPTSTNENVFVAPTKKTTVFEEGICYLPAWSEGGIVVEYDYDNEYGNLLETFEHGDPNTSTDDHRIVTTYIDNGWDRRIPTLPRTQTIYGRNGVGWEVAAQTNYDYVFQGSNTEALARVTTTQHGLAGSVDSTSMVHYNSHGNVDWTQDGLGNRTVVAAFDSANVFPSIVTYPPVDGLTLQTQTTYDPRWGTPKQVTGFNSDDITEYRYDPFGRLQEVEDLVAVTRYDYAKDEQNGGLEVATTYAYDTLDAYQTSVKYNALGQMIQSETEGGSGNIIVDYEYDGTGRQVWTSVPYIGASPSLGTRTEYDALGRPRAITNHDTTTQRFDYDGWQRTTFTNQEGHQTVYGKDAFGRTTWVRQYRDDTGAEPQTRYGYDTLGNLTDVWDAAASSNHTEMTYDGLGRTLTISDTDTGYWTYVYDANGNLITQTDARDQIITFEYDALNRLIAKCGSEICENLNLIAAYTYDDTTDGNTGLGRRTGMEDASGRTAWIYDAAGRLAKETKVISYIRWAIPYTTSFTYDFLNRLDTLTYPDDEIVTYGYDAGGQVNHLASGIDIYLQDAQYTALGQPDSLTLGAGVIVDFGYYASNNTGKPAFALESIYVNGLLNLNDYRYHLDGNLEHVSGSIGGSISPTNLDLTYSYNSLNWLDTVNGTVRGEVYDRAYAYDDIGNLTTKNDLALNYDTEAYPQDSNQPAHAPGRVQIQIQGGEPEMIDFGYDDNGNRITRLSSSGDLTMYDYDEENRLVELSDTTFVYDGDGNRIKEVDNDQDSTTYVNGYYEVAPWSDNVVIYNETGRELNPNMVSDDDGKLYLVWVECSSDDAGEVRFATRDPDTGDWSSFESIGHISDLIDDGCRNVRPVVSVDSDRNVTVAWNEYGNSSYNILARHQLAGGGWSAENLVANSSNDETFPSLVSAPDGTVFLAWQSCDGSDCTVHVARSMSGSWTNEYQTGGGGDQSLPALASDNEGTIYLVYADIESSPEDGFYLVRRQANAWVSSPEPVGINGDSFDAPLVLAIDSQGNLFVMQANDLVVDNNDIPYSITMEDPDDQWHPITVENTQIVDDDVLGADNPTIAVGPKGMLVAVWEGNKDGESTGLFMSYKSFVKHYFANGQRIATRTPDDSLYYLLSDHLGSTSVIVDSAGGEVGHIVYDPFGEVLTNTLTLTVTDRLFTGQRWDGTIGLYDYNARFYDPQIGQFTQPDSLVVGATNPIAWNRYAYVHNNPVNHTDSTGHVIDTLWDAYDLAADAGRCVFGSDALSCYMVPLDVAALAVPGVPGVADNAARHIDDVPLGRTAYLIGGLPQDMQGVEQIVELSSKYDEVIVNDIIPSSDLLTEFTLEKAGYQLSNVKYVVGDAAKLSPLHHTDIFAVAPNAGFHYGLVEVGEKVLGNESRLIVASNLSTAESLANTLRAGSASVFEGFYEAGDIITQVGSRKIRLTSRYLYTPGRHIPSEGWRNTLIIVTR